MTPEQLAKSGTEDAHQMAVFSWAALNTERWPQLRWLHAIPNGGLRSARTGAKMKATGARKGVWDIHFPLPLKVHYDDGTTKYCPGLYIEMKKPGVGRLSAEQKEFQDYLMYYGYRTAVCFTWEDAVAEIQQYLACNVERLS